MGSLAGATKSFSITDKKNVSVSDGKLHITAKKETFGGKGYTSGRIRTMNKGDWTYCKVEFRAKMPLGQGLWAAVWMLPTDEEYGGWPASGELDIMEYLGHETNVVHGTVHFLGAQHGHPMGPSKGTSDVTDGVSFDRAVPRLYALEWVAGRDALVRGR
jgi:beta-glucanase (GH16 family)